MPGRPAWTDGEVEQLRTRLEKDGYSSDTFERVAQTVDRSYQAVRRKARELGIHAPHNPITNKPGLGRTVPNLGISEKLAKRLGVAPEIQGPAKTVAEKRRKPDKEPRLDPILVVSDAHIPYQSPVWWDLLMQVGRAIRPKLLVIIGDFADFYAVSDHDKSPDRANRFDEELEEVERKLDELDSLGAPDKLYIEGNHEDRLRRYLMKNPALARVVTTEKLLRLKERGWEFVPYKRHAARGAVHYTHDVGSSGRNAIFRALDVYQHSVITGHTHRAAMIVEGTAVGECKLSASFGWGGDVEQVDYMNLARARKDWALAFGCGYLDRESGYTYFQLIPIIHSTCCVNGRLYRSTVGDSDAQTRQSA